MKIKKDEFFFKKGEFFFIVFLFLIGLFFIINNLFEYNYISQSTSLSMFSFFCISCVLTAILNHYKLIDNWEVSERLIMKLFSVFFVICIGGGVGLHLILGPTLWIRYITLFLWIVAGCLLFYTSFKNSYDTDNFL